ncbi:MAG: hypothetical protein QOE79_1209 [Sphingomonadales bacterium]|jgi:hypothetical protein|nr:hypothetical protein [Sphingomonadales bacterium]MEA3048958.1 hypothetical protein [Sphingomonadales bacterium]
MSFRVTGLSPEPFRPLFGLSDEALAAHRVRRYVCDGPGFPDRIEISDAAPGETLLLLNYLHQPAATPYRASHAIFVRERDVAPTDMVDDIPPAMRARPLSLRAFDSDDLMVDGDLVDGAEAQTLIERLFADPKVAYIHAHYARRGCYAGLIERA